jgi:hypothetical protein
MRKKIIIGIIMLVVVSLGGMYYIKYELYEQIKSYESEDSLRNVDINYGINNNNYWLYSEKKYPFVITCNNYILLRDYKTTTYSSGYLYMWRRVNEYIIDIYDIESGNIIKTLDITPIIQKYEKKGWSYFGNRLFFVEKNGKEQLVVNFVERPSREKKSKWLIMTRFEDMLFSCAYIDIDSEEVLFKENLRHDELENDDGEILSREWLNYIEVLLMHGIMADFVAYSQNKKYIRINIPVEQLPEGEYSLYEILPSLKNMIGREDEYITIYMENWQDDMSIVDLLLYENAEDNFIETEEEFEREKIVLYEKNDKKLDRMNRRKRVEEFTYEEYRNLIERYQEYKEANDMEGF